MLDSWVGYTGGGDDGRSDVAPPTYSRVCAHNNTHTEAVRLEFDPLVISYEALVRRVLADARVRRLQPAATPELAAYPFRKAQTRIAVWARDAVQTRTARRLLAEAGKADLVPVLPPSAWHEAEAEHQHFIAEDKSFADWSVSPDDDGSDDDEWDSLGGPGTAWGL